MSQTSAAKDALSLLLAEYHGVLSTQSVDMPGFPFGSVAPYCLDSAGNLLILISSIAQHTQGTSEKQGNVSARPEARSREAQCEGNGHSPWQVL